MGAVPQPIFSADDGSTTIVGDNSCRKCEILMDLYESTGMTPRDYWLMTELFVMLHGSDECRST